MSHYYNYSILQVPGTQMTPPFWMVNPEFYGSKPWKQWSWSFGFQAYHHNYKILEICANKYWGIPFGYHDPNPKSLFYLKLGPNPPIFTFSEPFPRSHERQRRRFQDVSKLGRPALQFSNQSGQHHRSVVHLSSSSSSSSSKISWLPRNLMKQLYGTLDGLGHVRSN